MHFLFSGYIYMSPLCSLSNLQRGGVDTYLQNPIINLLLLLYQEVFHHGFN